MSKNERHLSEDELTLFHYGELEERASAGRHLLGCPDCRAAYDELLSVLEMVDAAPLPEHGADYGARVWARLQPQLPARASAPIWRGRWAVAATLVLVLAAGFLAGRFSLPTATDPLSTSGPIPEAARARILRAAVEDHLERSGRMLVEIANDGDTLDMPDLQAHADILLGSNRLYRRSLIEAGRAELIPLLEDLERVLLDIAHATPAESGDALVSIRTRIQEGGLLFKVRIVTSRLQQEERSGAAASIAERT